MSNYTNVTVGGSVFTIPSDRIQELMSYLTRLQGIRVQEHQTPTSPILAYNGKTLINE